MSIPAQVPAVTDVGWNTSEMQETDRQPASKQPRDACWLISCLERKLPLQFATVRRSRNCDVHLVTSARWKDTSSRTQYTLSHSTPDVEENWKVWLDSVPPSYPQSRLVPFGWLPVPALREFSWEASTMKLMRYSKPCVYGCEMPKRASTAAAH